MHVVDVRTYSSIYKLNSESLICHSKKNQLKMFKCQLLLLLYRLARTLLYEKARMCTYAHIFLL